MTAPDALLTLHEAARLIPGADAVLGRSPYDRSTISDQIDGRMFYRFANTHCVYFIGTALFVKIGYTTTIARRLSDLDAMSPIPLVVLLLVPGDFTQEREFHSRFARYSIRGEWFRHEGKLAEFIAQERVKFA